MSHAEFRRISRWVFKYCCGVEFPSVLRKFAPLFLLPPRYTQVYQWRIQGSSRGGPGPTPYFWTKNFLIDRPPSYLRVWMTARLPLISRSGSGIVYWLKATHCWGNHCSCAPLPSFTFIYLCEPTTILVNFGWET